MSQHINTVHCLSMDNYTILAYGKNELNIDLSKSTFTNKQGINYQLVTKLV